MNITEQKPDAGALLQQMFMESGGHGGVIDHELAQQRAKAIQTLLGQEGDTGKIVAGQLKAAMG